VLVIDERCTGSYGSRSLAQALPRDTLLRLGGLQFRANRQELRAARRESRDISAQDSDEWTPRAWFYATAFGLSFFLSWYLLPALFFSF
jgi:hypothetical protein